MDTWLAISVASLGSNNAGSIFECLGYVFVYKIRAGIIAGFLLGKFLGYLILISPKKLSEHIINVLFGSVLHARRTYFVSIYSYQKPKCVLATERQELLQLVLAGGPGLLLWMTQLKTRVMH